MDDICLEKPLRLLRYIKALFELKFTSVKSYERYEKTLWIEPLRGGGDWKRHSLEMFPKKTFYFVSRFRKNL